MTIGAAFFLVGGLIFLTLLFASGGANRSRQLVVLGQLMSGSQGRVKQISICMALLLVGTGATFCFAGVALMDAQRATRCADYCLARGFAAGKIGPSVDRNARSRFVACTCTSPNKTPLETRADSVAE